MNPRMIIILILAVPIAAPAFLEKRLKVSTFHTVVGMGLCLVEAMTLFLVGGWDFLASGYEKKSYFLFMCVLAVAAFVIGGINLRIGARIKERHEEIVRNGVACTGKVFGYEEGEERNVSRRMVLLQVRYYDKTGAIRQALVPTDQTERERYPLGGNVTIWVWNGLATTADDKAVPAAGEESDLMMDGVDVYGTQPRQGTHCPNCGAVVNVPLHMRAKCPYCGNIISFDKTAQTVISDKSIN